MVRVMIVISGKIRGLLRRPVHVVVHVAWGSAGGVSRG